MATTAKEYPDFFRVFLKGRDSKRMKIPDAFVGSLHGRLPEEAILRNRSGRMCHVSIHNIAGSTYFDGGWEQIVEENSLNDMNFIFFKYEGRNIFKFKIFERTGCERIEIKEEEEQEEEDEEEGGGGGGGGGGEDKEEGQEQSEEEAGKWMEIKVEVEEEKEEEEAGKWVEIKVEEEEEQKEEEGEEEEEEKEGEEDKEEGQEQSEEEADKWMEIKVEEEEEQKEEDDDHDYEYTEVEAEGEEEENVISPCINSRTAGSSAIKVEDAKLDDYGIDAEKYVQLGNPYFLARLNDKRKNELPIPNHVIGDFDLRFSEQITLRLCCKHLPRHLIRGHHLSLSKQKTLHDQPTGTWEVGKVVKWKDGRVCIRGWATVHRRNKITSNDVCICEFILEGQEAKMLLVHIVLKGDQHTRPRPPPPHTPPHKRKR